MKKGERFEIEGVSFKSVTEAAIHFGISQQVAAGRLRKGWTIRQAFELEKRSLDKSLQSEFASVALEWHPNRNGKFSPLEVSPKSGKSAWWICKKGHEWETTIVSRTAVGAGCPYCAGKRATEDRNLEHVHPQLSKQWHPNKNLPLLPSNVVPESSKKFWWQCINGHEWQASPNNRSRHPNCPQCVGKKASPQNNLEVNNPELVKEWDLISNGELLPNSVLSNSTIKVWWRCSKGHLWKASVNNRNQGRGCPYCSNKAVGVENNLLLKMPEIAAQWLHSKNGGLNPSDVTPGSRKRVWWKCYYGHEWESTVMNRTSSHSGCPVCSPQTSKLELRIYTEVKSIFPKTLRRQKIAGKECDVFIPELNLGIEIDGGYWHKNKLEKDREKNKAFINAGIEVLRLREAGLPMIDSTDISFQQKDDSVQILRNLLKNILLRTISDDSLKAVTDYLVEGVLKADGAYQDLIAATSNPVEGNSLLEKSPEIAAEWNYEKNLSLMPQMISNGSSQLIWWKCTQGHEWRTTVATRTSGSSCPYCSGRRASPTGNLLLSNPKVAAEWNYPRNEPLKPENVRPSSGKTVWWVCSNGHDWSAPVDRRNKGSGCPYCTGRLPHPDYSISERRPDLISEWSFNRNSHTNPESTMINSSVKVWWRCANDHEWQASPSMRGKGNACPYCAGNKAGYENTFASKFPELLSEWDYKKNEKLTPDTVTAKSGKKAHWICSEGHSWEAVIGSRANGHGCPMCSRALKRIN